MDITHTVNSNVSALIKSAALHFVWVGDNISNSKIKTLRRLVSARINKRINEYTDKIDNLVNISSVFSSSIDTHCGTIPQDNITIICSIIWQIHSDISDDGIQQMMVDFIAKISTKSVEVYEKLPKIYEIGLYEVNDRAIGIENPRDILKFL